ncbi:alpha/beta fold hydrolase [Serratia plymuthica]|jgi:pimeloyl-ACP methyl ester carboxylesterase|uniref:Alpha/beta hydrolase n=1 Tax=Serratia plymuthica S13 TaxID=1348660 RepID=S4YFC8_SERPL|nr:alpha/beta hydrolase [Serratia plymuthica]AGP43195.1 alpha/beta hydrolase [Serratia plymuthica S13]ANJ92644.1 alpha/beta hydrolase [Serratia plymuthica]ANJ97293.1 alpha/beta hydrolase [Serratia plymuthica]EKF66131.1 alpha/beta hydrolase [Serratia plymuthica A30]KYG14574.1 2-hydroxy-6-oxo-6-phenylhexa-2,4-dienoate hydrolase [Serratia plymuthica]
MMNDFPTLLDRHIIVGGHRIAAGVHGAGDPLVLVHGTPAHSIIWRDLLPRLTSAGFQVHLYDLLGFGASERPLSADTSIAAQAELLIGLLDHWQLDTAHVFGHDIGGALSLRAAFSHAERFRSLTIADICSYDSWPSPTWRGIRDNYRQYAVMDERQHEQTLERQLKMAVFDKSLMEGELLQRYLAPIVGVVGQPAFYQQQIAHYNARYTEDFAQRLPELRLPVQILWGENDEWQPVSYAYRLQADIPDARLQVIPRAGHFLMEDAPETVAQLLAAFIHSL